MRSATGKTDEGFLVGCPSFREAFSRVNPAFSDGKMPVGQVTLPPGIFIV